VSTTTLPSRQSLGRFPTAAGDDGPQAPEPWSAAVIRRAHLVLTGLQNAEPACGFNLSHRALDPRRVPVAGRDGRPLVRSGR
jgi:hypothetical protein